PPADLGVRCERVVGPCGIDACVAEEFAIIASLDGPAAEPRLLEALAIALESHIAFIACLRFGIVDHYVRIGAHPCEIVAILLAPRPKDQSLGLDHSQLAGSASRTTASILKPSRS